MRINRTDIVGSGFIQFPPQRPFSERLERQPPTLSHQSNVNLYTKASSSSGPHNGALSGRYPAQPQQNMHQPAPTQHTVPASHTYASRPQLNSYRPSSPKHTPPSSRTYGPRPQHKSYQASYASHNSMPRPLQQQSRQLAQPGNHSGQHEVGSYGRGRGRGEGHGRGRGPGHTENNGRGSRERYAARFVPDSRTAGQGSSMPNQRPAHGAPVTPSPAMPGSTGQPQHPPHLATPHTSVSAPAASRPAVAEDANSGDNPKLTKQQLKRLMKKKRDGKL
jgi:hypothetical protein